MNRTVESRLRRLLPALTLTNEPPLDVSGLPMAQQQTAHRSFAAASSRLKGAALLREAGQDLPAILLYREGIAMLARVLLAARGQESDGLLTESGELFERFAALMTEQDAGLAAALREGWQLLNASDLDALPRRALAAQADTLAELTTRLVARVEPTSRDRARYVRYAPAASALVTLLCALGTAAYFAMLPTNIAKGKPVVASSIAYDTQPPGVVDGKDYGRFGFHSAVEPSPWIRVDLGRRYLLTDIKIFGRHDCCYDQSVPMVLEISDDGEQFRGVAERSNPFDQVDPWQIALQRVPARYVRVRTLREAVLVLSEIEVYGQPAT